MGRIPTVEIEFEGRRKIVNADDPRAVRKIPSKAEIAAMKKADVIEWLEAHGVEKPTGNLADLRDTLRATIYLED